MANYKITPIGRHHVVVMQQLSGVNSTKAPLLYISINGKPVIVDAVTKYFIAHPTRSLNWMRTASRAAGLFYDYTKQYVAIHKEALDPISMVRAFGLALLNGTITVKTFEDPLDLYWPSSSIQTVKRLMNALNGFTDWCISNGLVNDGSSYSLPSANEGSYLKYLSVALRIKQSSFFNHTIDPVKLARKLKKQEESKILQLDNSTNSSSNTAKYFPTWLVPDLLEYGFVVNPEAEEPELGEDITAKMITVLLLFGGLRVSEPFHIWFNDIIPQTDGSCKVFLRHPSDALTRIVGEKSITRRQYLAQRGLLPRNTQGLKKSYHAGWKYLAVDENLEAPVFFLHGAAENLIKHMFHYYLNYRKKQMSIYQSIHNADHPFLFVSGKGEYAGSPYSIQAYNRALQRAYDRLERKFGYKIPRLKEFGTTPHGPRHFYGQALIDSGINPKIIQKSLRHRSIISQSVYTEPKDALIRETLNNAKAQIESDKNSTLTNNIIGVLNATHGY
jgi:hypothetical protein